MSEKETLFGEFSPTTYDEWREAAVKTLKGASFEKKLVTPTYEGIDLQPLYTQEQSAPAPYDGSLPGFFPYVRSTRASGYRAHAWEVSQELPYVTIYDYWDTLRDELTRGQTAINIQTDYETTIGYPVYRIDPQVCTHHERGLNFVQMNDFLPLLETIDLNRVPINIYTGATSIPIASLFFGACRHLHKPFDTIRGCIGSDPLGYMVKTVHKPVHVMDGLRHLKWYTAWALQHAPLLQTIVVDVDSYHDGGGTVTHEVAYAIATGVFYLRELLSYGISIEDASKHMRFNCSIGEHFFMEIAKLRAMRLLWAAVVRAMGGNEDAQRIYIHARTSFTNKTLSEPHLNMLRSTTEAFSAVVGGVDSLYIAPFNEVQGKEDTFGRRIARNTHTILREESHLDQVIDPAGGSWFVETVTNDVARNAWALFQEVEQHGGMFAALTAEIPQHRVMAVNKKRIDNIAHRRDVIVGTNMYVNIQEPFQPICKQDAAVSVQYYQKRSNDIHNNKQQFDQGDIKAACERLRDAYANNPDEQDGIECMERAIEAGRLCNPIQDIFDAIKTNIDCSDPRYVHINPLSHMGKTWAFDVLRENATRHAEEEGSPPVVFLANMGPIAQHKARADFVTSFVNVGGFTVIRNDGFATVEEAAHAAIASPARAVVICSTDDTYPDIVPQLTQLIKQKRTDDMVVLVAGYPTEHIEALKAAGIDEFIHLRANCYELNYWLQQKTGVHHETHTQDR